VIILGFNKPYKYLPSYPLKPKASPSEAEREATSLRAAKKKEGKSYQDGT
jgi:hypothetical protein